MVQQKGRPLLSKTSLCFQNFLSWISKEKDCVPFVSWTKQAAVFSSGQAKWFLLSIKKIYSSSLLWYLTASSMVRMPLIFFTSFTQWMWSLRMVASSISLMAASILSSFAISTAILKSKRPNDSLMFLRCPSWIPTSLQIKNLDGFPDKDNRSKSEWLFL